jgi:anti-sigma regulatory factor (Ser/Thr protein kinase)
MVDPTVAGVNGAREFLGAGSPATVVEFAPTSNAIREARKLAVSVAGLEERRSSDLALAVSELATNAVLHARTPFVLSVDRRVCLVRVVVSDGSVEKPELQRPSAAATTGRGLNLIDHMVDRWGVDIRPDGKDVWFEMSVADEAP